MSSNFNFSNDMSSADHDNDHLLFANNNGLDDEYGVDDASNAFGGSWDAPPEFFTNPSDTFGWPDPSSLQQQHHQQHPHQPQQQRQLTPSSAFRPVHPGTAVATPSNFSNTPPPSNRNPQSLSYPAIDDSFLPPASLSGQTLRDSSSHSYPPQPNSTVSPEVLQSRAQSSHVSAVQNPTPQAPASSLQLPRLSSAIPKGTSSGSFLVYSLNDLQQRTQARDISPFLAVGQEPVALSVSGTNIPAYYPRKSRAQISGLLLSNKSLNASVAKKAPKKPGAIRPISRVARLQTSGKAPSQDLDSGSDDLSDESESESEDEDEEAPIPSERPSDLQEATRWDAVKALWRPARKAVPAESIREGLKLFWEDIKSIRERWKTDQESVEKAEEEKKVKDLPIFRERAKSQRELLEVALKAAVQHGHPSILANMGRSKSVLQILNAFLRDRNKATDHNGSLAVTILEFLSRCGTLDNQDIGALGLDKVLVRYSTRGDSNVKAIVKRITNNFGTSSAKKPPVAPSKASPEPIKNPPAGAQGVKRTLPSDTANVQPAKKIASEGKASLKAPVQVKKPSSVGLKQAAGAATATSVPKATKMNQIYAKPSGFISSLQSAKRTPVSSAASKAATADKKNPAIEKKAAPPAASAPAFSFASILADVNAPAKPKPVEKKTESDKSASLNETPEERARRLRKEQRRKHRVSWAPEESLVRVKYFEHDSDEELGHDAAQTRDVGDTKSESRMFKHMLGTSLDIEDDEDGDSAGGDPFIRSWQEPALIDFTVIPDGDREHLFAPYGGSTKMPESPEKTAQESREANALLAIYTDDADIPPSPKEPHIDQDDPITEVKQFGSPPEHLQARIDVVERAKAEAKANARAKSDALSAELSTFFANYQQPLAQTQVPAMGAPSLNDLSSLIPSLASATGQQSASSGPSQYVSQAPAQGLPGLQTQDISSILAALNSSTGQAQNPPQAISQPSAAPILGSQDISSLLATLGGVQAAPQPLQSNTAFPSVAQTTFNSAPQTQYAQGWPNFNGASQLSQGTGIGVGAGIYENEQRKRLRESDSADMASQPQAKRTAGVPYNFKTQPCKFWQIGKCMKGAECTYRHGDE